MSAAATVVALLGAALLTLPRRPVPGLRLARFSPAPRAPARLQRRRRRSDPLDLAATWDLLAACLRAGQPVPAALRAVADDGVGPEAQALRATAGLLELGADANEAWAPALVCSGTAEFARAARRTARSGTTLADAAADLAHGIRADLGDRAEARAQRAGVLIAGPLGLCFLPAFVCLGVAPVVLGLAGRLNVF
ncbi:type II secretion system F family protein [Amycolatopsis granulosa]|uniref:type II secretion system F family protein n=1 Tax=Amycolatopsis granulosa TaxID=185684 RepID=UPI0014234B6E|nr:type II secretion system F family protein [Amycolatopsis granulosa]NIH86738.1 pilus assembly protein TadC [Amycolatopsis granulosa]